AVRSQSKARMKIALTVRSTPGLFVLGCCTQRWAVSHRGTDAQFLGNRPGVDRTVRAIFIRALDCDRTA
ncbi:MAG: hypothetical protein AAFO83_13860, partial [Cyanobacteria bacterium J06607_13]